MLPRYTNLHMREVPTRRQGNGPIMMATNIAGIITITLMAMAMGLTAAAQTGSTAVALTDRMPVAVMGSTAVRRCRSRGTIILSAISDRQDNSMDTGFLARLPARAAPPGRHLILSRPRGATVGGATITKSAVGWK